MSETDNSSDSLHRSAEDAAEQEQNSAACPQPTDLGALSFKRYTTWGSSEPSLLALSKALKAQAAVTSEGDFRCPESMLITQAHTLDAIFNRLALNSADATGINHQSAYLKLALKAQSQCRSTLEALAEIKAPKAVAFVRQANIAQGHQQVNNGFDQATPAREKPKSAKQTKQSKHHEQQTLDARGAGETGRIDPAVETLGAVDRADHR